MRKETSRRDLLPEVCLFALPILTHPCNVLLQWTICIQSLFEHLPKVSKAGTGCNLTKHILDKADVSHRASSLYKETHLAYIAKVLSEYLEIDFESFRAIL